MHTLLLQAVSNPAKIEIIKTVCYIIFACAGIYEFGFKGAPPIVPRRRR